jgi:hypothetical protein
MSPRSLTRWLALAASLPLAFLLCAGGCSGGVTPGNGDGGTGDGASPDGAGDGSTSDADLCPGGTWCGSPAACCPAGNECVSGACLEACASGVRCGADQTVCCAADTVCLANACATPGPTCQDSYDCEPGNFCEPTLGRCLPQPDPLTCRITPDFTTLQVTEEWSLPDEEIISIPVVANLDGVGAPEVVVNLTQQDALSWPGGRILVLDGASGAVRLGPIPHDPANGSYGSHGRSTIAVGDVSGDGLPDIVYAARPDANGRSLIVAIDRTGALLWISHNGAGAPYPITVENGAATLANFDDDEAAEVVFGGTLIDNDGRVVWDGGAVAGDGGKLGTNGGYTGGIAAVADLDDDGQPEIVTGRQAWKVTFTSGASPPLAVTPYWTYVGNDGYPAVADLDGDGQPEVVLVASGQVVVLNGRTGALLCGVDPTDAACLGGTPRTAPIAIPGGATSNRGGPPTVADFDGDGRPEIGVAGGYSYSVYDLNRPGEAIPAGVSPAPAAGALFVRWSQATQDLSSNATGSAVFDFQGDGAAEVVYADECYLRVYSGVDGTVQLEYPNTSGTIHEFPVVVDVDGDGNSEILVVANVTNAGSNCPGVTPRAGLFVYGDPLDRWVPTRKVWTQHAYHVTNATAAGNVPLHEDPNWAQPGLNNYRQNVQGDGVFNAPDLALDLSVSLDRCGLGELLLRARVTNLGALGVPAGIEVSFHAGTSAAAPLLGTGTTAVNLLPGAATVVELAIPDPGGLADYYALADVGGAGAGTVAECNEANNGGGTTAVGCPPVL